MGISCKQCKAAFEIRDLDRSFYSDVAPVFQGRKYEIPTPTLCPSCRQQRRLAFRNERHLFQRTCDLTKQLIVSSLPADSAYPVYSRDAWWADGWDAKEFGQEIDFNRPFIEQWQEVRLKVPRLALLNTNAENSEYCNYAGYNKDCYLLFAAWYNEGSLYGKRVYKANYCVDSFNVYQSQFCYGSQDCLDCYECHFSQFCDNCSASRFLFNCRGCQSCAFCWNLNNKHYCILNEQCTKEEYEKRLKEMPLGSYQSLQDAQKFWKKHLGAAIRKEHMNINAENVVGNCVYNSRNCFWCFDIKDSEDIAYSSDGTEIKSTQDVNYSISNVEQCYETVNLTTGSRLLFCANIFYCNDLLYCDHCMNSNNLFGCIGLKKAEYCILNKQYTKEEYFNLLPRVIELMQKHGEWGEFFPVTLSPFPYNESVANEYFPIAKDKVSQNGWEWREEDHALHQNSKGLAATSLPDTVAEAEDSICDHAITCERSGRPFKILKQELEYYRKHTLPLPRIHPDERHVERVQRRNPTQLWDRTCAKCSKTIRTSYAPERPEIVYCESCYLATIY